MPEVISTGSCLARLRASLRGKPRSGVRIARFILDNPARARALSIGELARACAASPATVTRFCQRLGYAGFKAFQGDLAATLAQPEPVTLDQFVPDAPARTITRLVFECNRQSLIDTEKLLNHHMLSRVAKAVLRAGRVVFIGVGDSAQMAREAARRFVSLGLGATAADDPYDQIFATANLTRGDVVMGISHSGQTASVVEAIQAAGRQRARTVALTNYPQSPLAQASELHLITAYREQQLSAAVSSSRIAQMCIIDSLYFIVAGRASRKAEELKEQADRRMERMVRWRVADRTRTERKRKKGESGGTGSSQRGGN
jgi:DNA-binding MurR/RpiR family transcriptional regulator